MTTVRTRTFKSGNSQAIRLPREIAYPDGTELEIVRSGDVTTIYPVRSSIREMLKRLDELPGPSSIEVRDEIEIPERPGL
jgi:antitoxin VapB